MKLIQNLIHQANQIYSSQYAGILSNHLPMALFALDSLGADDDVLQRFYQRYIKRLAPKLTQTEINIQQDNWTEYLGRDKYHQDYLNYFKSQIETYGLDKTLRSHLPVLFVGVAGGAFHGLIRLSYALESQQQEEIIEALGYWAISYLALTSCPQGQSTPPTEFPECLQKLNQKFEGVKFDAPNIVVRMQIANSSTEFSDIMSTLDAESLQLNTLATNMATALCATRNFTILHGVTACHAARNVCSRLDSPKESIYYLAYALALAYVTIGAPKIEAIDPASIKVDWDRVTQAAISSLDDHIPKIVYSCQREYEIYENPIFLEAAKRYVT